MCSYYEEYALAKAMDAHTQSQGQELETQSWKAVSQLQILYVPNEGVQEKGSRNQAENQNTGFLCSQIKVFEI